MIAIVHLTALERAGETKQICTIAFILPPIEIAASVGLSGLQSRGPSRETFWRGLSYWSSREPLICSRDAISAARMLKSGGKSTEIVQSCALLFARARRQFAKLRKC